MLAQGGLHILSVSVPVSLLQVDIGSTRPVVVVVFICNLMRIGRWSELSVGRVCQEHELMREVDANVISGELGSAFDGTRAGISQWSIP